MRRLPALDSSTAGNCQSDEAYQDCDQRCKLIRTYLAWLISSGLALPALRVLSCHQKVPSSDTEMEPTHSSDGTVGCTTRSPSA